MSAGSIQSLGSERFYVRSVSDMCKMYLVDLGKDSSSDLSKKYLIDHGKDSCNCPDWPRVRLCKHIAAVAHFSSEESIELTRATRIPAPQIQENSQDAQSDAGPASDASMVPILENMISVSRELLSDGPPSSPGTVRSLQQVESHLMAVIQNLRASQSALPDKESLLPNQRTWTKTAERMGAKQRKRPHPTNSSPTVPATERIGILNRKQPRVKNTDPYSGGLWSGKDAALDAQTAAQNVNARARAAATKEPAPSQPTKQRHKRAGTPPPPPSSVPVPGSSAPLTWYLTHAAYPFGAYSQVPYHATYPVYWPYGHFSPFQPYYPTSQ